MVTVSPAHSYCSKTRDSVPCTSTTVAVVVTVSPTASSESIEMRIEAGPMPKSTCVIVHVASSASTPGVQSSTCVNRRPVAVSAMPVVPPQGIAEPSGGGTIGVTPGGGGGGRGAGTTGTTGEIAGHSLLPGVHVCPGARSGRAGAASAGAASAVAAPAPMFDSMVWLLTRVVWNASKASTKPIANHMPTPTRCPNAALVPSRIRPILGGQTGYVTQGVVPTLSVTAASHTSAPLPTRDWCAETVVSGHVRTPMWRGLGLVCRDGRKWSRQHTNVAGWR